MDAWNQLRLTSSTHRWYKRYQALIHGVVLVKRLVPQKDTGTLRRSDHAERLIRGPTIQRCGELLAEERPSSQGGLQPQNRAQRPLHRRRQFGIRGHGRHSMDSLLAERCSGCNFALRLFSDLQGYQMEPSMIRDGTPSSARETCSECVCVYVHIKES